MIHEETASQDINKMNRNIIRGDGSRRYVPMKLVRTSLLQVLLRALFFTMVLARDNDGVERARVHRSVMSFVLLFELRKHRTHTAKRSLSEMLGHAGIHEEYIFDGAP